MKIPTFAALCLMATMSLGWGVAKAQEEKGGTSLKNYFEEICSSDCSEAARKVLIECSEDASVIKKAYQQCQRNCNDLDCFSKYMLPKRQNDAEAQEQKDKRKKVYKACIKGTGIDVNTLEGCFGRRKKA